MFLEGAKKGQTLSAGSFVDVYTTLVAMEKVCDEIYIDDDASGADDDDDVEGVAESYGKLTSVSRRRESARDEEGD